MTREKRRKSKDWRQQAREIFLSADSGRTPEESVAFFKKAREIFRRNGSTFGEHFTPLSNPLLLAEYKEEAAVVSKLEEYRKIIETKVQELNRSIDALLVEEAKLIGEHDEQQIAGFNLQKELFAYHDLAPPLSPVLKGGKQHANRLRPEITPVGTIGIRSFQPVKPSPLFERTVTLFGRLDDKDDQRATKAFAELLGHVKGERLRFYDIFFQSDNDEVMSQALLEKRLNGSRSQVEVLERETAVLEEFMQSLVAYEGDLLSEVLELRPLVASLRTQSADIREEVEAERKKRALRGPPPPQPVPIPRAQSAPLPQPGPPSPSQTPPRRPPPSHQPPMSQTVTKPQAHSPTRPQPAPPGPSHTPPRQPSPPPRPSANQALHVPRRRRGLGWLLAAASIPAAAAVGMLFYSDDEAPTTKKTQVLVRYVQRDVGPITEPRNNAPPTGRVIQKGMRVLVSPKVEQAWRRYFDTAGRPLGYIEERDLSVTLPPEPDLYEDATHVLYAKQTITLGPVTIGGKQFHRLVLPGDPLLVKRITFQNGLKIAHIAYSANNREYGTVLLVELTAYPFTGKMGDALARAWTTSCAEFKGYRAPWIGAEVLQRHKTNTRVLLAEQFIDAFRERWTVYSELKSGKYIAYIRNTELGCPVNDPLPVRARNQRLGRASILTSQL